MAYTSKSSMTGLGADVSIVLFANKYHSAHKTTDETIEQKIPEDRKEYIGDFFKYYHEWLKLDAKRVKGDTKYEPHSIKLENRIYLCVICFLYELEYEMRGKKPMSKKEIQFIENLKSDKKIGNLAYYLSRKYDSILMDICEIESVSLNTAKRLYNKHIKPHRPKSQKS